MQETPLLKLPIYDQPDTDHYDITRENTAKQSIETGFAEMKDAYSQAIEVNANLEVADARQGSATLSANLTGIKNSVTTVSGRVTTVESVLPNKATKDGSLQVNLNTERVQGVRLFCQPAEPSGVTENDVWFDTTNGVIKTRTSGGAWRIFGAAWQ